MDPFTIAGGIAAPFPQPNCDTDIIMPKRFLKTVTREGLAAGTFADLRFNPNGAERDTFILNRPAYRGAIFLVVGDNFGCGSSREHAVWGLRQLGVRALIGTTFAGIFFDNCRRNGLLAISLSPEARDAVAAHVAEPSRNRLVVDLINQRITGGTAGWDFDIDASRKNDLVHGRDAIQSTLDHASEVRSFEAAALAVRPWLGRDVV